MGTTNLLIQYIQSCCRSARSDRNSPEYFIMAISKVSLLAVLMIVCCTYATGNPFCKGKKDGVSFIKYCLRCSCSNKGSSFSCVPLCASAMMRCPAGKSLAYKMETVSPGCKCRTPYCRKSDEEEEEYVEDMESMEETA